MTNKVTTSRREVYLGGTRFPIVGRVRSLDIVQPPPRRVEGDITRESNPNLSTMSWSDFRGGMGLDIMEGFETDRCWESNLNIRFPRSIILSSLATETTNTFSYGVNSNALSEFYHGLYAAIGNGSTQEIWQYQPNTDTWTNTTRSAASLSVYHMMEYPLDDGTEYLIIADGSNGYLYKSSTTITDAFSSRTQDTDLMTIWDSRLWGIGENSTNTSAQLWWTYTPGSETLAAKLLNRSSQGYLFGTLQAMWTGRTVTGEDAIYVKTANSAFVYDAANDKFVELKDIPIPVAIDDVNTRLEGGGDGVYWRGKHYMSFGSQILEYDPINLTVRDVFFARERGLSGDRAGIINKLAVSDYELYASTIHSSNKSYIYAWDGQPNHGWYELYNGGGTSPNNEIREMMISGRSSNLGDNHHRLYFLLSVGNSDVSPYYINLPKSQYNPKFNSSHDYAASGTLKTSWFHADQVDVDKLAVRLKVETTDTSANETVKIEYAVDYDEGSSDANYKTLANDTYTDGLIDTTATGVSQTTFKFPVDTVDTTVAPVGKTFRAIRFKVSLARGGTTTNSPRLISMTLEYRKKFEHKEGFQFVVDMTKSHNGLTPAKMRTALQTLVESNTMSEFTFRDDPSNRNYYVDVRIPTSEEEIGHLEHGQTLVEVREL